MKKTFQPKTVEKYLDFLHFLHLQLRQDDPQFKIYPTLKAWKINTNLLRVLQDRHQLEKTGRGKYRWVGERPDKALAKTVLEDLFLASQRKPTALLTGPTTSTPLGAEVKDLKARVSELETVVLQLMEKVT